jgi:hypothetical protein
MHQIHGESPALGSLILAAMDAKEKKSAPAGALGAEGEGSEIRR